MNKPTDKRLAPLGGLSAAEALYGFMGWLTTRYEVVTLSAMHEAGIAAELVSEFCKVNGLAEPRDHWEENLIHPPSGESGAVAFHAIARNQLGAIPLD